MLYKKQILFRVYNIKSMIYYKKVFNILYTETYLLSILKN